MGKWKQWEIEYLRDNYERLTRVELARKLDRSKSSISNMALKLKLRKDTNSGQFKPGHVSRYTGPRKPHYTWFQPGNTPRNAKQPGVYLRRDHTRPEYMIKHEDGRREPLAHALWKKAHGDIPKGYVIAFQDGNSLNCNLENLICISRAEHLQRIRATLDISSILRRSWRKRKGVSVVDAVLTSSL